MDESPLAGPEPAPPAPRPHDPLAVALGNASLLGVGYLLLRRRGLAVLAVAVTVVLVSLLVSTASPSYEVAVGVWWTAVIAHGWFLTRAGAGPGVGRGALRGQRLVALGVTLPVLLAVGLLRFDASRVGESVAEARERGDCAKVESARGGVWFGHRMADAPLTARGDENVEDCRRLETAGGQLTTGLTGDTTSLEGGFETLASVLAQPGNEKQDTYGDDHSDKLPGSWKAADATDAVLVVCMGADTFGSSVQTCPYRPRGSGSTTYVTFRKIAVPVKVYELRTGKLVSHRTLQIGGSGCPAMITYYSGSSGPGPASNRYVSAATSDVRSAFRPLVNR
ncbi:hypothetical protein [Streptomyces violaceusniger]|uniref:hypothetical protein n=1 Tax=Streptomyces violaceusniger TaxID=68280 RepID=UPI00382A14CF